MIWFTWRQLRPQTVVVLAVFVVLGALLIITGRNIADAYDAAGLAGCTSHCEGAISGFLHQVQSGASGTAYNASLGAVYVAPLLVALFWGAPLIARELETGTYRLAWSQSVTRTRWLVAKLAVTAAAATATAGLLSWAVTAWAGRIDDSAADRITPLVFGARGIVPIGYALFGVALAVVCGMLIRRTVPAMAATLGCYVLAVVAMPLWLRAHLLPATHASRALGKPAELMIQKNGTMLVVGDADLPGAWLLSNTTVDSAGTPFTGPVDPAFCGPSAPRGACQHWLGTLDLRQSLTYQPADRFWPLQWMEAGVFVAAAVLLVGFCFWWTRRRLT